MCMTSQSFCNLEGTSLRASLIPVKDDRFRILEVKNDCELKGFIEAQNLTFQSGAAFYEFTRTEEDVNDKEVILMDKV